MNDTKGWDDLAEVQNLSGEKNNLLLVDGNNLAFRFLHRNNYSNYEEEYIRTIHSLGKSYKAKRIITLFDFGHSQFRMKMFPQYKENRKRPTEEADIKHYEDFFNCLNTLTPTLPVHAIEYYKFRGIEADDLITFFVENLHDDFEEVWIISSDKDLFQLLNYNTNIFSLYSRKETTEDSLLENTGCSPDEFLLSKIIMGDYQSDAIPGIEGIGEVRSQKLARDYKTFENLLDSLPIKGSRAKYIQNLNAGKDILIRNEKLITLKKYNEEAIRCVENGNEYWDELQKVV